MKKKVKVLPIYLALSTMLFSSCGFPYPVEVDQLTNISIVDLHNKYALGETFYIENELRIEATYSKSGTQYLSLDQVGYTCTYIEEGVTKNYTIEDEFTVIGTYSLFLNKDGVNSNTIEFEVITEHVFVTDITITGNNHMNQYEEETLTVNVIPSNYTTSLYFDIPEDKVDVDINKHTLTAFPTSTENFAIKVTTQKSKTETISYTFNVTMNQQAPIVDPNQDYDLLKKHAPYTLSSCPISGSPKMLVIPVWFSNSSTYIPKTYKDNIVEDIRLAYFGSEEETGWHSVSSYYNAESFGKLALTGTVSEWYNSGYNTSYIERDSYHTENLVITAVNWYFNNHDDDRSNYDSDNDGYLDAVVLIYGAPDYRTSGQYQNSNLWAYTYWLQEAKRAGSIIPNVFFWASYDFMYGYDKVMERTGGDYPGGDTSHCNIDTHTFIHEMGHVLGLDDYYDYSDSNPRNPAAGFSMQDYNVGGHDPFSVFAFDWAKAFKPTSSTEITIGEFQSTHDLILLTPSWNTKNSPFDEYLLLELFTPTGLNEFDHTYGYRWSYPRGAGIAGIRLWHVDARLIRGYGPSSTFYTDASLSNVQTGMNNSSGSRTPPAGSSYVNYILLQLIRRDTSQDYKSVKQLADDDLFIQGDTFTIDTYKDQFYRRSGDDALLNNGKTLGWSFTISQIYTRKGQSYAKVVLTKA